MTPPKNPILLLKADFMLSGVLTKFKKKQKRVFANFLLVLLLFLILSGAAATLAIILFPKVSTTLTHDKGLLLVNPVRAADIYSEFLCPCCGRPLDPDNICCGSMKEMIDYIDKQTAAGFSKDEIMLAAVKEFGFDSLAKESTRQSLKIQLAESAPIDAPRIVFEQTSRDLGRVSQKNGEAFVLFAFKNEGRTDLIINKLSTSCGCTLASIIYRGEEGPVFTMPGHGKENPDGWSVAIAPGEEAQVKVYYDPNAHGKQKEDVLAVTRTVSVFSNDPVDFEKQIKIELTQTP